MPLSLTRSRTSCRSLRLLSIEHFQCFVEIGDNRRIFRIAAFYNNANIVVRILVVNATKEYRKLISMVIFPKPTLEKQTALVLPSIACVAYIKNDRSIDTEKLNKDSHNRLFHLSVALNTNMAYVIDVKLIGIAIANGRIFLKLYLIEYISICLKQIYSI